MPQPASSTFFPSKNEGCSGLDPVQELGLVLGVHLGEVLPLPPERAGRPLLALTQHRAVDEARGCRRRRETGVSTRCNREPPTRPGAGRRRTRAREERKRELLVNAQYAPRPLNTAGIVLRMIETSSQIDQFSRYVKSSRTRSSKERPERPEICQRPVMPGKTR